MAELINCIECNGQISSEASRCPHCKTSATRGIYCFLCDQIMKPSEAITLKRGTRYEVGVHRERCFASITNDSTTCPLCSKQVALSEFYAVTQFSCTNCGHHISTVECSICGFGLFKDNALKGTKYGEHYYGHKVCVSAKGLSKLYAENNRE